jgi:glycosyltransferase involved in cell wall biosynthesis
MVSLAVPTYKRPASLRRLLVSLAEYEYRSSLDGVYVFDDEETADNETEAVVSAINHDHNLSIEYAGRHEKLTLVKKIADSNNDLFGMLQFAFWGMKECRNIRADGMNRNAILLYCIDRKVVSADDDTLFSYLAYKQPAKFIEKAIARKKYQRIQENPFFSFSENGWDDYKKGLVPLKDNPFLKFDQVLGSSPQNLGFNFPLDGNIKVAHSGVFDGCWYMSPMAVANANPLNYKRWNSQTDYAEAKQFPHALYLSPTINLTTNPFFFAAHFGYDTSGILPPFLPHIRNDDAIWAAMVRDMYPDSPLCRLPFAIHHNHKTDPLPGLSTLRADITANGLIGLLINYAGSKLRSNASEAYLKSLGAGLVSAAKLSKTSWRDVTQGLYAGMQSGMIRQAEQKLAALHGEPPFLAADLRYYSNILKQESGVVRPWIPSEFAQFGAGAESLFREYVKRCGELFSAWPEIWERAKSLKAAGAW